MAEWTGMISPIAPCVCGAAADAHPVTMGDTYVACAEYRAEADVWFDYRGQRWSPPFTCMCCGKRIDAKQWGFGRACGYCDTGACQKAGAKHPHRRQRTQLCENGHVVNADGRPVAPLSPAGDETWMLSSRGRFGGGAIQCRCAEPPSADAVDPSVQPQER